MIWSLLKTLIFIAVVIALTVLAGTLLESTGGIRIAVGSVELNLGPLQAVIAAVVFVIVVWLAIRLIALLVAVLRFLNGDETAISRHFNRRQQRKGLDALADGMLALASGDGKTAAQKAARARRYLHRPDLTDLVTAQAAEMTGDTKAAEEVYRRLLGDERTRFVGIRGLLQQRLVAGDDATALKLAEQANALKPKHAPTQDLLLKLQAEQADWAGARQTLGAKLRLGSLPRDVYKRRDAVLALQEAKDILAEGNSIEAREAAITANRESPDLVPAAALAARTYIAEGNQRLAARILKRAWEARPHPELAAAFAEIVPDESPLDRRRRFNAITRLRPAHEETRQLLAELDIAAEDFPGARRALGDLIDTHPTARVLTIMAAIERGEGASDAVVRGWLTRALTAPRGPQWVCSNCHNIHAQWVPICENCGAFDTLDWLEPPAATGPSPTQTELLPLIAGQPEEPEPTIEPEPEPEPEAPAPDEDVPRLTELEDPLPRP